MIGWTDADLREAERRLAAQGVTVPRVPQSAPKPTGRLPQTGMNKVESKYAQYLDIQKASGAVRWWAFEAVTVKIGNDCRFTPDFLVMAADGSLSFADTKGTIKIKTGRRAGQTKPHVEEDAAVKARVLAANFVIPIYFVWQREDGEWERREL